MNRKDKRSITRRVLTRIIELLNHLPGADRIHVHHYVVESKKLPQAFDGFTMVQISDIHGRMFGREQERLLAEIENLAPDIIVCSGDWIDLDFTGRDERCVRTLIKGLMKIAPVYGILGNHEARAEHKTAFIRAVKQMGVTLLLNSSVQLQRQGQSIALTGFLTSYHTPLREDPSTYARMEAAYAKAMPQEGQGAFCTALGHRPELLPLYENMGLDLVLSGHAHGGLMKLPGGYRLLAPGQGWFPKLTHGAYQKGKTRMIVSCGLGGPRVGIAPEIGHIILKRKS